MSFLRNYGLDIRIARFHHIFGHFGTWTGGRKKVPATLWRKVVEATSKIEVWGDGQQTRSFLFIDNCIEAVLRFMSQDDFYGPVNIGSEEMVSINQLAQTIINLFGKDIDIINIGGQNFIKKYGYKCPTGVRARNANNTLYKEKKAIHLKGH